MVTFPVSGGGLDVVEEDPAGFLSALHPRSAQMIRIPTRRIGASIRRGGESAAAFGVRVAVDGGAGLFLLGAGDAVLVPVRPGADATASLLPAAAVVVGVDRLDWPERGIGQVTALLALSTGAVVADPEPDGSTVVESAHEHR